MITPIFKPGNKLQGHMPEQLSMNVTNHTVLRRQKKITGNEKLENGTENSGLTGSTGHSGLPLEVFQIFRSVQAEMDLSISFQTEISGIFG